MMIKTNKENLIQTAVLGEIVHASLLIPSYIPNWDGVPKIAVGYGGINYNVKMGDLCYGWASGDHVEPGVTLQGKECPDPSTTAMANLACCGNEALVVVSENGKGAKGMYVGRHAGEHSICWFGDEDLHKLAIGDKIQVKSWGVGLKIEGFEQVKTNKLSPVLLEKMRIEIENGKIHVPVVKEVPGYLMGSGIGFTPSTESVDYDIQTTCPEVVEEFNLKKLRLGDIVAIRDQACIYGRGHYRGALTIGVIIHGWSDIGGHGPGVNPLLSSLDGELQPIIDPDANMALYLGLRESL